MIGTFEDLLTEIEKLGIMQIRKFHNVKHPIMIGNMYEGLTRELLNKAIFKELDLRVVSGKISNEEGQLSGQLDCMIVSGDGEKLPFSQDYIYDSKQVIAVVEVKKNLYTNDLIDAYENLQKFYSVCDPTQFEFRLLRDMYRSIVREELPSKEELIKEPFFKQMIYHTLIVEASMPIRIAFGYEGFKSEKSLRDSFIQFMGSNVSSSEIKKGFGPNSLPNLIISGDNSLVKINGMPYCAKLLDKMWLIYSSYPRRPLLILLELLWTKLTYKYGITSDIFGDDLVMEQLRPLLFCKCIKQGDQVGWEYRSNDIPKEDLEKLLYEEAWEPSFLNDNQQIIIHGLCENMSANLDDKEFINFILSRGYKSLDDFINEILSTDLVYIDHDKTLKLLTDECDVVILPDGRVVAGENKSGRLTNWVMKFMHEYKEKNPYNT